ncbi:MAG TPA: DUF3810 domain-containing protein [Blastocatellia bacterium]|nr:DUF3810 domain-containing protein [Blastocatellia bacterium]HMY72889.1 DUF3810 domain-containing protein [Blastocatellia bacterium]HMZ18104.1 DUF3810 domain-containing protein [Blastocatellia bacterium]HNG31263.1 DUF3810 domain-containing protein [Blastocatellia bacterium]
MPKFPLKTPLRPAVTVKSSESGELVEAAEDAAADSGVTARYLFWRATFWLMVAFGIQTLASLMPDVIEEVYSQTVYYHLVRGMAVFNQLVGLPLGELLIAGIVIWYAGWTIWYLGRALRREVNIVEVFKILLLQWAALLTWGFAVFLLMWGLNYQRTPIEDRLPEMERLAEGHEEIIRVGERIVDGINRNYTSRNEQTATGASFMPLSTPVLYQTIEKGFQLEKMLGKASQGGFGPPKPLIFSRVTTWLDIRGVYVPFTGEALYNDTVPDCDKPFVIAHFKAHQRGFAREDEANFIAYAVCINSNEPYIRYSGYLHGLKVLDFLEKSDAQATATLKSQLIPPAMDDMNARNAYWAKSKSQTSSPAAEFLIKVYLRANRVRGGLKNFSEDTPLIVNYMLRNPER